jgi:hypothetical protein
VIKRDNKFKFEALLEMRDVEMNMFPGACQTTDNVNSVVVGGPQIHQISWKGKSGDTVCNNGGSLEASGTGEATSNSCE